MNHIAPLDSQSQERHLCVAMGNTILGQIGSLQVRLATRRAEIDAAQAVRYDVFHGEYGVAFDKLATQTGRDTDSFDAFCDHLIVIDTQLSGPIENQIVGTYRLMRGDQAKRAGNYYSANEFAVASLLTRHKNRRFLELGRSCVIPAYRSKRTVELLWQGIWAYVLQHDIDVMMGCASFSGTVPAIYAEPLSFLHNHANTKNEWHIAPLPGRHVSMDLMPAEAINTKSALTNLPALIKGYLRLGASFGDGAVIDHQFKTIDVMVVLPVEHISERYKTHYGHKADRYAA